MIPPILLLSLLVPCATDDSARFLVQTPTTVARGTTRAWTVEPGVGRPGSVFLEIRSRMDARAVSGSMYFLEVFVNGVEARPLRIRQGHRIVNKPFISAVARGLEAPWNGEGGWRVVYARAFETTAAQSFYADDPYTLRLDVTDLVDGSRSNRVEIRNTASREVATKAHSECDLWIERLVVRSSAEPSPLVRGEGGEKRQGRPGAGYASYTGSLHRGGGFSIKTREHSYRFESRFTYPGAGWNHLDPVDDRAPAGQPGWTVRTSGGRDGAFVLASGPDYRIERKVRFGTRQVEVSDAITNLRAETPLGLMVRHELILEGLAAPRVRLAGNPDPSLNDYYSPGNPSVHVGAGDEGIGLICEDDVFRNQARLYYSDPANGQPPRVGLRTEMLRLAAGETYVVRWSVYPVAGADYFDFINLVRDDWHANETVEGAWLWGYDPDRVLAMSDRELGESFRRHGIRVAIVGGGWIDKSRDVHRIGFGAGVLDDYWASYRRRIRESAEKIRRAVPGARVLVYYNSQRDSSGPGPDRYRDSRVTDSLGRPRSTEWNGLFQRTDLMVATRENTFGRAMLKVADVYMDEMKADGLYWDEMESTQFGYPEITHDRFDGHTCRIDPKHFTIVRELGLTTLLAAGHRADVVDRVRRRGGLVLGNGPTCVRQLSRPGVARMVEIQHNQHWSFEGNLQSPLGYLSSRARPQDGWNAIEQACLPVAIAYEYPWVARLFPFTPIELHEGYLLGKERIVTTRPGAYGWPGARDLVLIHRYDRTGTPIEAEFSTRVTDQARTELAPEAGEVDILERLPVVLVPTSGEAIARCLWYSAGEIRLRLECPAGARLGIRTGRFRVPAKQRFRIAFSEAAEQSFLADDGGLTVPIPAGFRGEVRVSESGVKP